MLQHQEFVALPPDNSHSDEDAKLPTLFCLPVEYYQELPIPKPHHSSPLIIASHAPRLIGIVAHELLQWICDHHPASVDDIPWELASHQLQSMGFEGNEYQTAKDLLYQQLAEFFNDPTGQWLKQSHEQEQNEYQLLVNDHHTITTKIIDRTFCENGIRWIIDFKTGQEDAKTQERHHQQVNDYAKLFASQNSDEPVRCGLYYLASNHWIAWDYKEKINEH